MVILGSVVRNVVLVKLKPGVEPAQVDRFLDAMLSLQLPGLTNLTCGRDLGLRDGNFDIALVADLEDEEAYRAYDADAEHNRIRRELIGPLADRLERCQYQVY